MGLCGSQPTPHRVVIIVNKCRCGLRRMAAGRGKILLLVIFGLGLLIQSPFMFFQAGFFQSLVKNFTSSPISGFRRTMAHHVRYLGQEEAIKIDEELFNEYRFSVDQLMEMAGISVATAIHRIYGPKFSHKKVVIVAGPGNNGGDGIVAARHLKLFGFSDVTLLHVRKPTKDLFVRLTHQAELNDVLVAYDPQPFEKDKSIGLLVDALFGFSFKPPVRQDFVPFMNLMTTWAAENRVPVVSVDIPSGWDVEKGPPVDGSPVINPETLVSLTAPKLCAKSFKGLYHFLGGRFVPPKLATKYNLDLPDYRDTECIIQL